MSLGLPKSSQSSVFMLTLTYTKLLVLLDTKMLDIMTLSKERKNPKELDLRRTAFQGVNRMIIISNYQKVFNEELQAFS